MADTTTVGDDRSGVTDRTYPRSAWRDRLTARSSRPGLFPEPEQLPGPRVRMC